MMLEILDLMTPEQVDEWERLTEGRDIFDYFNASHLVNILTDHPPVFNPVFQSPKKIDSELRKLGKPETTDSIIRKISEFCSRPEYDTDLWGRSLWFLAFKYGYDTVEEVLDRLPKERLKIWEVEDFVKLVHYYDEMKLHPLTWTLSLH